MASKNGVSGKVVRAGLAGAAVGAVVTGAAVALSDKKNRKKVTAKMQDLKKQTGHTMQILTKKYEDIRGSGILPRGTKGGTKTKRVTTKKSSAK